MAYFLPGGGGGTWTWLMATNSSKLPESFLPIIVRCNSRVSCANNSSILLVEVRTTGAAGVGLGPGAVLAGDEETLFGTEAVLIFVSACGLTATDAGVSLLLQPTANRRRPLNNRQHLSHRILITRFFLLSSAGSARPEYESTLQTTKFSVTSSKLRTNPSSVRCTIPVTYAFQVEAEEPDSQLHETRSGPQEKLPRRLEPILGSRI
jgi:hypothetical protein